MPANRHILVVDDDEDIRTLVCLVLESEGYRPTAAAVIYFFGNFRSALISRICRMCRCSCVEISSAH
jgi:CheY-like chemotaxis protein